MIRFLPLLLCLASQSTEKPNFVILLCDDLGYGDLGCFGNPIIKTPNLDKLAAEGLKLPHGYAAMPVCSPSRAALLTGRNPNRQGIHDWIPQNSGIHLKKEEVTIARLLKSAGYRTGVFGKWHLNSRLDGTEPTPGDHGFDQWMVTQNNAGPSHQDPVNFVRNGEKVGPLKGNSSTIVVDEAIRFAREAKDGPFFLFVPFHAPHEPIATPKEFTPEVGDPTKAAYYGSVSLVDHEVGRLLAALDELKLRERTFVLFTSDNGPETLNRYKGAQRSHGSPGPLRGMKLHVTEAGIRVPAILRWPGKTKPGQVCEEPVMGTDLLPTICAIVGVETPADRPLDGASFLPIFSGRSIERNVPMYWQYDKAIGGPWKVAIREGPWKLLANATLDRFALYNVVDDIGEKQDLVEKHPDRVKEMAARMAVLHRDINR